MIKISKGKNTPLPDFFNFVSLECNKGSFSKNFFIKSINSIECLNNFSKNYKGLIECTKLAQFITKNSSHLEDIASPYEDFLLALKAYISAKDPRFVNIKYLYKFCRREGFPIKEDFASNLPPKLQDCFVNIINTPSDSCEVDSQDLEVIYKKLSLWLSFSCDIIYN